MAYTYQKGYALNNYGSTLTVDGDSLTGINLANLSDLVLGDSPSTNYTEVNDYVGWAESYLTPTSSGDKTTMLIKWIEHWSHWYKIPISAAGDYRVYVWVATSFWTDPTTETWTLALSTDGSSYTNKDTFSANAFIAWKKMSGDITASGSGHIWVRVETDGSMNPGVCGIVLYKNTGTAYYQSAAGTMSSAGAQARKAGKKVAGAISTLTGAIATWKYRIIALAGEITPAGALSRLGTFYRALAGSLSSAGGFAKAALLHWTLTGEIFPLGFTDWFPKKVIGGSLASAGAIKRKGRKALAGVLSTTAGLRKFVPRRFIGAMASAGGLVRKSSRHFAGAMASAGVLGRIRNYVRTLTGAIASAGAQRRKSSLHEYGSMGMTGNRAAKIKKIFTAGMISAGALARSTTHFVSVTIGGVITSVGVITRYPKRTLRSTLTSSGLVTRKALRLITAGLASAGGLRAKARKALGGVIAPAAALIRLTKTRKTGSMPTGGATYKKTILHTFAGLLSPIGVTIAEFIGAVFAQAVGGVLSASGGVIRKTKHRLTSGMSSAGTIVRLTGKAVAGVINPSGIMTRIYNGVRSVGGALGLSGAIGRGFPVHLGGILSASGDIWRKTFKITRAHIFPHGALVRMTRKALSSTLNLAGSLRRLIRKVIDAVLDFVGLVIRSKKRLHGTISVTETEFYQVATSERERYTITVTEAADG